MTTLDLISYELDLVKKSYETARVALMSMAISLDVIDAALTEIRKQDSEINIVQMAQKPVLSLVPVSPVQTVVPEPPKSNSFDLWLNGDKPVEPLKPKVEVVPVPDEPLIINDEWRSILNLLDNGSEHVFITGDAGTGKSTLLGYFLDHTRKSAAVVAPTGVAALRVKGETIHRFFKFGAHAYENDDVRRVSDDTKRKKYEGLNYLVIDEISMVRADMMDAIEKFLRLNGPKPGQPFGGVRLIVIGDLFQLPPVSKEKDERRYLESRYGTPEPFFFHAECWKDNPLKIVELTTIFRQKDPAFTGALNAIRRGTALPEHLTLINSRVDAKFIPPTEGDLWLTLTTTNAAAEQANRKMLSAINAEARWFDAIVEDEFNLRDAPTADHLELKPGMAIMFVRNDVENHWVNGTMGKVVSVRPLLVEVKGEEYEVEPETWEQIEYVFDEDKKKLTRTVKGKFIQIPLKPAAAITIHKSQGLSLDHAIIDLASGTFAAGQGYVAVSRLRSLEGMVLRRPFKESDLITSNEVVKFMTGQPIARPAGQMTLAEVING